jgi:hypothetical protein
LTGTSLTAGAQRQHKRNRTEGEVTMSYTIKGGKILRREAHNQKAVDKYCREVVAMSTPISEAELLDGTVTHVMMTIGVGR